jgi:prepilin-type N-terminal cleavage/methylation domain-containing protein
MVVNQCLSGSRGRGYTLIEMLIVIGVLGLAGALLVPHLVGGNSLRVQAAVRKIIADLSFAQMDALAHQEYRRVQFIENADGTAYTGYCIVRVNSGNYAVAFDPDTADYIFDPLGSTGDYVINFTTDDRFAGVVVSAVDIDNGGDDIVYDSLGGTIRNGGAPGSGGTIEVTAGEDVFRITVEPFTGKLTVGRTNP